MTTSPGRAVLIVERDGHPPQHFALADAPFRIGRAATNELHVPEAHVSKAHAEIRPEAAGYVLLDLQSRAGVFVNGQQTTRHALAKGDVVTLGPHSPVRIRFEPVRQAGVGAMEMTLTNVLKDFDRGGMSRLARFFEFSRKLGGGFAIEEVLQDVVDLAVEVTKAERGMLIVERAPGDFEVQLARSNDGRSLPTDRIRISETLVRQAFQDGRARVVEDVNQQADLAIAESIVMLELRSAVTLPLLRFVAGPAGETARSVTVGLIYLDSRRQRGGFDGLDLRILERLAQDASSVIENARLLREAEQKQRIERELQMASEIQATLIPERFEPAPAFSIAGRCVPCHQLGGDYVDQFVLPDGRQTLIVADVCGKGIGASLLAATLQGALAAEVAEPRALGAVATRLNRVHCRLAPVGKFITAALVVLEPDGRARVVNAGHCPPLVVRKDRVEEVQGAGMAFGLDDGATFREVEVALGTGDAIVLFTDGVVECEGEGRELFGQERLDAVLRRAHGLPAVDILQQVLKAVDDFRGDVAVSDDLSLLVVRRN